MLKKYFQKIKALDFEKNAVWAILFLAAVIRFTGLVRRDFWYDEAFTGVAVKESFYDMIQMIINDVHPPLYYILLKIFSFFFNYSVFGIRLFSAVFGVVAVWGVYLVTKQLFNKKAALWASFVVAVCPFAIQYSQEARMYSMLVTLILFATLFFFKALETEKKKYFIFWGILAGLSMLTHYMGIIFSSTYFISYLFWAYFKNLKLFSEKKFKQKISLFFRNILPAKNIFLGYGISLIVFLPWINNFRHHLAIKGNLTWVRSASFGDIIGTMQMFLFGTPLGEMSSGMPQPNEIGFFTKYGTVMIKHMIEHISIRMVLAVLLGMSIVWLMRKENKAKIFMLLTFSAGFMILVYILSLLSTPNNPNEYFVARYLLPGAYFFFIYVGLVLSNVNWKISGIVLAVYFVMLIFIIPLTNSQGYNEMILHMDKYKNNNFYILNSFDYVITKYYIGANRLTLYNYDWPGYNPSYWAAIGDNLKRTEDYEDLRNDPNGLIISNKVLNHDNQYFSTEGLELVDRYNNILIYKFKR